MTKLENRQGAQKILNYSLRHGFKLRQNYFEREMASTDKIPTHPSPRLPLYFLLAGKYEKEGVDGACSEVDIL